MANDQETPLKRALGDVEHVLSTLNTESEKCTGCGRRIPTDPEDAEIAGILGQVVKRLNKCIEALG